MERLRTTQQGKNKRQLISITAANIETLTHLQYITTMTKHLITLLLAIIFVMPSQAQQVYKEVMRLSQQIVNDTKQSLDARKMAQFKVDALDYMVRKTQEFMPDSLVTVLDYQAFALFDFINLFTQQLTKNTKKKDRQRIMTLFQEASLQNARFFDTDKEYIHAYVHSMQHITRFSLDTDWVAAINEVRQRLYNNP